MTNSLGALSGSLDLAPYRSFTGVAPAVPAATQDEIVEAILEIVAVEGPIVGSRLYGAYGRAAGHRMGSQIAARVKAAIQHAVRRRLLVQEDPLNRAAVQHRTFRLPDRPAVVRRELGPRAFVHVPLAELADVMRLTGRRLGWDDSEAVLRATMAAYGIRQMGSTIRATLQSVVGLAHEQSADLPASAVVPAASRLGQGQEVPVPGARLGWSITRTTGAVDLDVSVFLLGADNRVRSDEDFVFYNHPRTGDGSVRILAVEEDTADDSTAPTTDAVELHLDVLAPGVRRVLVAVSVDEGSLSDIRDLAATASGAASPVTIPIEPDAGSAVVFAEVSRRNSGWWLRAYRRTHPAGLGGLARALGVDVED